MSWVYQRPPEHTCSPPPDYRGLPDGEPGDLWRCDECGTLWSIYSPTLTRVYNEWRHAGWWRRHKARAIEERA